MALYNFLSAFVLCGVVILIGEAVSRLTKAWVPSVFVSAVVLLIGYWTVLPTTLVTDSTLIPLSGTLGIFLLITHLGTIISPKRLMDQWKIVVICLAGLLGMCVASYFLCPFFMDMSLVIAGLPPLTGGIVAATMMQNAAMEKGLEVAAVFAISMYCVQGFAGYPLTAVCLKMEAKKLLEDYRNGKQHAVQSNVVSEDRMAGVEKKGPLSLPEEWNSPVLMLTKLALVGWGALLLGGVTGISGAVWALVLGVIFCRLGFLDKNILVKSNSAGFLLFGLTMFVFDGLKVCTPEMLLSIIVPMIALIVIGVAGMAIFSFVVGKIVKISPTLAFATSLNALYGYPFNAIITESICNAATSDPKEREYLMSHLFPPMIVGGFVTVTIASVVIAGIFIKFL